jgi:glutamate/tyrosine decarboxylase-like PLP-dependent enzyme
VVDFRPAREFLELADSITWDAHKTLPVPMGAGMFFCRSRLPQEVFAVRPTYLPDSEAGTEDAYQQTIQWSRRFIGLKVFLTLAELGAEGVARLIDHQASMAQLLRESLAANGWRIVNGSPLPLVCFGRDEISADNIDHIAKAVVPRGFGFRWLACQRGSSVCERVSRITTHPRMTFNN